MVASQLYVTLFVGRSGSINLSNLSFSSIEEKLSMNDNQVFLTVETPVSSSRFWPCFSIFSVTRVDLNMVHSETFTDECKWTIVENDTFDPTKLAKLLITRVPHYTTVRIHSVSEEGIAFINVMEIIYRNFHQHISDVLHQYVSLFNAKLYSELFGHLDKLWLNG